jgi:hypothetical protein
MIRHLREKHTKYRATHSVGRLYRPTSPVGTIERDDLINYLHGTVMCCEQVGAFAAIRRQARYCRHRTAHNLIRKKIERVTRTLSINRLQNIS